MCCLQLEYTLDNTKEGYQQQQQQQHKQHDYYGNQHHSSGHGNDYHDRSNSQGYG